MKEEQFLDDGRIIRTASIDDLNAVSAVEAECFPPAEAASKADFERRIRAYGNHFWLMFENGQLVSFVDGMVTNQADLTDDLYEHAELHDESGDWQMIFGVNTIPSCRKKDTPENCFVRQSPTQRNRDAKDLCSPAKIN